MTTTFAENRQFLASLGHNLFRLLVAVGDVSQSLTSLSAVSLQTLCSPSAAENSFSPPNHFGDQGDQIKLEIKQYYENKVT